MSKYIDKNKVLEYIIFGVVGKNITCGELTRAIESLPTIEVSEDCDTCKWGEWYRNGRDITNMDDECGGCCSWNSKWTPKETKTEAERLDRIDNEIEDAWARIRELTADTAERR